MKYYNQISVSLLKVVNSMNVLLITLGLYLLNSLLLNLLGQSIENSIDTIHHLTNSNSPVTVSSLTDSLAEKVSSIQALGKILLFKFIHALRWTNAL